MPKSPKLSLVSFLFAASCSAVNPQIGQLGAFKQQAAAGNWPAIANAAVACAPGSQGCAQLHQIKADACLLLEKQAASLQQVTYGDCAVAEYQAAIAAQLKQLDPAVDTARLQTAELAALSRRRDHSRSTAEAARFNDALLTDSEVVLRAAPTEAVGYYYLGDALLSQSLSERPATSCGTLSRASKALDNASQRPGVYADAIAQRRRDIANTVQASGCEL